MKAIKIKIDRKYKKPAYTIGHLYIDGVYFCDTLEDRVREIKPDGTGKIKGATAIPAGTYKVKLTWSPRFRRVLPILQDVPHYDGIRIHSGNTALDTEGCILVGKNDKVGRVDYSIKTLNALMERLTGAEDIEITIL